MGHRLPKGHKKLIRGWAFYDWANSVYSLVISSAVFPIFYGALTVIKDDSGQVIQDHIFFLGIKFNNDALISYVTALAFIIISFMSPFLSGVADYLGNKKRFMKFFNYLGALGCIGLYWFDLDYLWFGLLCYLFGLIGFWGSIVFYNSYLPDIAYKSQQDKASSLGFSLGYLGSILLLVVCLVMILNYDTIGFSSEAEPTRLSFVLTGLWWIGFSQYTYNILPLSNKKHIEGHNYLFNGFKELKKVFLKVRANPYLEKYLLAFFIYSMAVQTIMLIATYFGVEEINWGDTDSTTGLITSILLIQFVAIAGAYLAARIAIKHGNITVLIGINVIWVLICIYAYFIKTPIQFYIAAFLVGLVMGAIQSISRSTYSKYIPDQEKDTTSFFSFFDVTEKVGIVIGMSFYGLSAQLTGSVRQSILFLLIFFVVGLLLLIQLRNKHKLNETM
ncbi:MAG: MFS transporter [Psychroflexus sp.]|nr:MFS transporter [Psychroflexus sp.]MDR9449476.1 MFS transporter [Psychroflexus sp.]